VGFLYPNKQPFVEPSVPTLSLPLRVGVAFVPPVGWRHEKEAGAASNGDSHFSEAAKRDLVKRISAQFKTQPYVVSVEFIPLFYLRSGGGFENLDQLRSMMGLDVIVLLAYDQHQNTTDTPLTLSYWTIVGAYTMPAQKNSTATLMEAAVFDIASRKMLFRAAGQSMVGHKSSLVGMDECLKKDSEQGFAEAAAELATNLQEQLEDFKVRMKESPEEVKIVAKPGYSLGAGALGGWEAGVLVMFGVLALARSRGRRAAPDAGQNLEWRQLS